MKHLLAILVVLLGALPSFSKEHDFSGAYNRPVVPDPIPVEVIAPVFAQLSGHASGDIYIPSNYKLVFGDITTTDVSIQKTAPSEITVKGNLVTAGTSSPNAVSLPDSSSSSVGVLNLGGSSFLHSYPGIANFNTFLGNAAGNFTLTGTSNTGVGYQALKALTSGSQNTAIGRNALQAVTTGTLNTAAGYFALNATTTGTGNSGFGIESLQFNTTGNYNTAVGNLALQIATASSNTAVGNTAMQQITTGFNNVAIGDQAIYSGKLTTGAVGIGQGAMQYATGVNNNDSDVCIGVHCLYQSTNASYNIGLGRATLYTLTTGIGNIAIGYWNSYLSPLNGLTLTPTSGTANLGVGIYAYKVAYTLNGTDTALQQSIGQTVTTDSTHKEVTITAIPTYSGPLSCTARKIYRTKVGFVSGIQRWYLVTTIADNTTTTFVDTVADASIVTEDAGPNFSVMIGYAGNGETDRTCYKSSQFCLGTDSGPINEMWLGRSVYSATPSDILVSASGASGSNTAGANLILSGGPSTGTAASGKVIFKTAAAGGSGSAWNAVGEVAEVNSTGLQASTYQTVTNCSSSASPAVCGSAAAGSVAVPTGTNPTLVVNTTAVTANSQIFLNADESLGTKLGITCNSTLTSLAVEPVVTARTAATSFTVQISGVISTNAVCLSYFIVN